jgi:ATP adenylyltransferase
MVAPVAHLNDFRRVDDDALVELNQLVKRAMNILDAAIHPKGFNVGFNQDLDAGAGLKDHIHIHVVPRWRGDTNFMTTIGEARVLAEDVDSMWRRLRKATKNGA